MDPLVTCQDNIADVQFTEAKIIKISDIILTVSDRQTRQTGPFGF